MAQRSRMAWTTGSTSCHQGVETGTAGRLPTMTPSEVTKTSPTVRGTGIIVLRARDGLRRLIRYATLSRPMIACVAGCP